jgi:hypothetical protein
MDRPCGSLASRAALLLLVAGAAWADALAPADLVVHPAIRDGELALFPIAPRAPRAPAWDFILLDEGLAAGSVTITEIAAPEEAAGSRAGARAENVDAQRNQQVQQDPRVQQMVSGDGAQVNHLSVRNASDRPLLLIAGEMVRGAKQDRIVAHDVAIPPGTSADDLDVFCVESGRWIADSTEFSSARAVSGAAVRATAQLEKSQAAVWSKVSGYNAAVGASSATESLNAAYDKPEVKEWMTASQARLEAALAGVPDACGAVLAVGGRFVVADLFGSPDVFRRLRGKLLAGYLLDAVSTKPTQADPPGTEEASRYLAAMLEAPRVEDWRGCELLVERFETSAVRGTRSSWRGDDLHVNGY